MPIFIKSLFSLEKSQFIKQFSWRLRDSLIKAGFGSSRASSGIDINQFSKLIEHSPQICRKYLKGLVIPEPQKLQELAMKLKVSPGWLLFGDEINDMHPDNTWIHIDKHLLKTIFSEMDELSSLNISSEEKANFFLELIEDVCKIESDEIQLRKIIRLAIASVKRFHHVT